MITASGTATVQAALHERPMVIVYRVSPLSYWLGRRFVKVDTFGMANLIAGKPSVPELIQDGFTPEAVARETTTLLQDPVAAERMRARSARGAAASRRARAPARAPRRRCCVTRRAPERTRGASRMRARCSRPSTRRLAEPMISDVRRRLGAAMARAWSAARRLRARRRVAGAGPILPSPRQRGRFESAWAAAWWGGYDLGRSSATVPAGSGAASGATLFDAQADIGGGAGSPRGSGGDSGATSGWTAARRSRAPGCAPRCAATSSRR